MRLESCLCQPEWESWESGLHGEKGAVLASLGPTPRNLRPRRHCEQLGIQRAEPCSAAKAVCAECHVSSLRRPWAHVSDGQTPSSMRGVGGVSGSCGSLFWTWETRASLLTSLPPHWAGAQVSSSMPNLTTTKNQSSATCQRWGNNEISTVPSSLDVHF